MTDDKRTNDPDVMRKARAAYDKKNPRLPCLQAIRKPEPEASIIIADIEILRKHYGDKQNGVIAAIRRDAERISKLEKQR